MFPRPLEIPMRLRLLCRVVCYDAESDSVLLVRNRGQKWWYAPGGGWEYEKEDILTCAEREGREETGLEMNIECQILTQTLFITEENATWLEMFWLASPKNGTNLPEGHIDEHGVVEEARWFKLNELNQFTVYPVKMAQTLRERIEAVRAAPNMYIGHTRL